MSKITVWLANQDVDSHDNCKLLPLDECCTSIAKSNVAILNVCLT